MSLQTKIKKYGMDKVTIIIIASFFFYFMAEESMDIVIPLFFEEKGINIMLYGTLLAATRVIRAVIVVPISLQTLKRKFQILKLVIVLDVFVLLLFTRTSYPVIVFAGFAMLLTTTSVVNVILNPILGFEAKERVGIVFGVRDAFLYAGCFLGLLLIGSIRQFLGNMNLIWICYSMIFLIVFYCIWRLEKALPETQRKEFEIEQEEQKKEEKQADRRISAKKAGFSREMLYYLGVVFLLGISGGYANYLPLIATQKRNPGKSCILYFSSSPFYRRFLGDYRGVVPTDLTRRNYSKMDILILMCLLLCMLRETGIYLFSSDLWGLATAFDNVMNAYVFANFSEEEVNRFWGVIGGINLVSFSVGTFVSGMLYEWNYRYLFVFAFGINLLGLLLSMRLKDSEKIRTQRKRKTAKIRKCWAGHLSENSQLMNSPAFYYVLLHRNSFLRKKVL